MQSRFNSWVLGLPLAFILSLVDCVAPRAVAGPVTFSLSFDGTLTGNQGQSPIAASGVSFVPGVVGEGASFSNGSVLEYASSGNIDSSVGTLDFILIPNWNGNDNLHHVFLTWGGAGGMDFEKDSADNIRAIFNRFGANGEPELGVAGGSAANWKAGQVLYLAYTWNNSTKVLNFYLDGTLQSTGNFTGYFLPRISTFFFEIGGGNLDGTLDELRISNVELSAADIAQSYQELTAAPAPPSFVLAGIGILCMAGRRWYRRKRTAA